MNSSIALTLAALAAALCGWRVGRYRRRLTVAARRNDTLELNDAAPAGEVRLGSEGFFLSAPGALSGCTVLLQLTIFATPLGHLRHPWIEIHVGHRRHQHYFERGASGQRYLNLSPLFAAGNADGSLHVNMRGVSIRWQNRGQIVSFARPDLEDARVLVLAPHPDDAELAAYGLYANRNAWVVTITAGEKCTAMLPADVAQPERSYWAALLRVWDSLCIPRLGLVAPDRCVNLVYPDGALESMHAAAERPHALACAARISRSTLRAANQNTAFQQVSGECTWTGLVGELRTLLDLARPDIVVCPHPVLDSHADHIFTTVALASALESIGGSPPLLFLYALHGPASPLFPFVPASSLVGMYPGSMSEDVGDSVYSHDLPPILQQAKFFALNAMHGLRGSVLVSTSTVPTRLESLRRMITSAVAGTDRAPPGRRNNASRPNEMFIVLRSERLPAVVAAALKRRAGPAAAVC